MIGTGLQSNRPMESSQWQCGKYSTRRVMLGTCSGIDFVPGWSYRTGRPPLHVKILARLKELPSVFVFLFFAQFGWRFTPGLFQHRFVSPPFVFILHRFHSACSLKTRRRHRGSVLCGYWSFFRASALAACGKKHGTTEAHTLLVSHK